MRFLLIIIKDIAGYLIQLCSSLYQRWSILYKKHTYVMSKYVSKDSIIGNYCYIGHNTTITRSHIGNYCSIASNVSIGMGEHDLNMISTNSIFYESQYDELTKKDCIIGNDVWIGVDAIIRRGITIGNGAVIGANSFVNNNVPPYAIVAGSPAKILRYRFTEDQIDKIEKSEWWKNDKIKAKKIMNSLIKEIHA